MDTNPKADTNVKTLLLECFHLLKNLEEHVNLKESPVYQRLENYLFPPLDQIRRPLAGDTLDRLKRTQCCDPIIDGLLGAAIEEIQKLRAKNQELRLSIFNTQGDDLCWMKATPEAGQIPPKAEFLESCARFHAQIASEHGELEGCKTIAQLEREVAEHDASFELRWAADVRAIKRWREAHPEKGLYGRYEARCRRTIRMSTIIITCSGSESWSAVRGPEEGPWVHRILNSQRDAEFEVLDIAQHNFPSLMAAG